jgi:hypothetical protein
VKEADEITLLREALKNMLGRIEIMKLNSPFGGDPQSEDERIALCLSENRFPYPPYGELKKFELEDFRQAYAEFEKRGRT